MKQEKTEIDRELESGKYLFKYCKFDVNALQIIINKTLYFSTPEKLNDPLDSKFDLKIKKSDNFSQTTLDIVKYSGFSFREEFRELLVDVSSIITNHSIQKMLFEEYFTYMQNTYVGICSFSTKISSANLLWSHYADEAKGLCLVFDKEHLIQSLIKHKSIGSKLFQDPVNYEGIKPIEVEINEDGSFNYTFDHLLSKTQHWAEEKEFRMIKKSYITGPSDFNFNRFYPFSKFDDLCLKFIITGQRIQKEHLNMLGQLQKEKVFEAELIQHAFDS